MKILSAILLAAYLPATASILEVEAGDHDRVDTVVSFPQPENPPAFPALRSPDGKVLPVQLSDDGTGTFILPKLPAKASATFELVSLVKPMPDNVVTVENEDGGVSFSLDGKPVATFRGRTSSLPRGDIDPVYQRGGYLHPLVTPGGKTLTDDYPANHLHHHGVWTAWTKVVFQDRETDFWNMGKGNGKVDCKRLVSSWSGPVFGGIEAENEFTDLTSGKPVIALDEKWTVKIFAIPAGEKSYHLIELASVQETAGESTLVLPEYHYGGIGIRGLGAWDGAKNASFVTSENVTDRDKANANPASWIAMSGPPESGSGTISILGSPENFRAPQPVRVHPTEPFVSFAPQIAGPMEITPGTSYRSAYRFVLTDEKPDPELLERLAKDFAEPPATSWK